MNSYKREVADTLNSIMDCFSLIMKYPTEADVADLRDTTSETDDLVDGIPRWAVAECGWEVNSSGKIVTAEKVKAYIEDTLSTQIKKSAKEYKAFL